MLRVSARRGGQHLPRRWAPSVSRTRPACAHMLCLRLAPLLATRGWWLAVRAVPQTAHPGGAIGSPRGAAVTRLLDKAHPRCWLDLVAAQTRLWTGLRRDAIGLGDWTMVASIERVLIALASLPALCPHCGTLTTVVDVALVSEVGRN